ncbi:MAG: heme biosynthesis HemY N-terminal domain-containing protein [Pseudomonadota bacterium]
MIRTFVFFLILAVLVIVTAWVAGHPGTVLITFGDYRVRSSAGFLLVAVAVGAVAAILLDRVWRLLATAPRRIAAAFREKRRRRGERALTQGLVAVAAGDAEEASRLAKRAEGLLRDPPLVLLLAAQAAQLRGDERAAAGYFESMLDQPEMAFLGIRGLFVQALREGNDKEALRLADRAYALHPKTPWVVQALFSLLRRAGDWREAEATLTLAIKRRVIPAAEGNRQIAALKLQQSALAEDEGRANDARDYAKAAWKSAPDFAPAAIRYARLSMKDGKARRARKAIEKAWSKTPHPNLAMAYLEIFPPSDALRRFRQIEKLAVRRPDHPESHLTIAEAALAAHIWGVARDHLAKVVAAAPSARAFRCMAELEEAETGNAAAAEPWRRRVLEAPSDAAWVCGNCGTVAESWSPVCANCGTFDGFAWALPGAVLGKGRPELRRDGAAQTIWFPQGNGAARPLT